MPLRAAWRTRSPASQTLRIAADGVTITNAQGSRLTIDGGQIDASKIRTDQLDASRINVADLQLAGSITWGDLAADTQNAVNAANSTAISALNTANAASSNAMSANNAVIGWTYTGTTYIDGAKLMTGTVRASTLEGGEIYLLDGNARRAGSFTFRRREQLRGLEGRHAQRRGRDHGGLRRRVHSVVGGPVSGRDVLCILRRESGPFAVKRLFLRDVRAGMDGYLCSEQRHQTSDRQKRRISTMIWRRTTPFF